MKEKLDKNHLVLQDRYHGLYGKLKATKPLKEQQLQAMVRYGQHSVTLLPYSLVSYQRQMKSYKLEIIQLGVI